GCMAHRFEQRYDAFDVGSNEHGWVEQRAVDVGFGGEVEDEVDACDEFANQFEVADVAFDEGVVRVARDVGDVGRVRGVGEAVEVDDRPAAANERTHDVAPNEPAAAGDE